MTTNEARNPGDYLRSLRRAAHLTQPQLAERAGVAVRTISAIETGKASNLRTATLTSLANALDTEPGQLIHALTGGGALPQPETSSTRTPHGYLPVTAIGPTLGAITHLITVARSSAEPSTPELKTAIDEAARTTAALFTAYALAVLSDAAGPDREFPTGPLVALIAMQAQVLPDPSSDRVYLDWLLHGSDPSAAHAQEFQRRWREGRTSD